MLSICDWIAAHVAGPGPDLEKSIVAVEHAGKVTTLMSRRSPDLTISQGWFGLGSSTRSKSSRVNPTLNDKPPECRMALCRSLT